MPVTGATLEHVPNPVNVNWAPIKARENRVPTVSQSPLPVTRTRRLRTLHGHPRVDSRRGLGSRGLAGGKKTQANPRSGDHSGNNLAGAIIERLAARHG